MTLKIRLLMMLALSLVIAIGCTKSRTPCSVHGKVSYNGKTVGGGTISFYPKTEESGGGYGINIKPDGTYEGASMPAGEYEVAVETESANRNRPKQTYGSRGMGGDKKGQQSPDDYRAKMMKMGKAPESTEPQGEYVKIPGKYNDRKKSGLTTTLTNGRNEKNFDLSD